MIRNLSGFIQEPLKAFLPSLSDESKEAQRLECKRLALTLAERNAVSLKAALEGITLDEAETYGTLQAFAKPVELAAITADINRMFIEGSIDRWDLFDQRAMPACLNLSAEETRERAGALRELVVPWFGARAGNAARQNQTFLWPSWLSDESEHSSPMLDWPVRLPCPCCGSDRDGVFTRLQPIWQFDEAPPCSAPTKPCQHCGHVDHFGCACEACSPGYARILEYFADHARILPSLYRTITGIDLKMDEPCNDSSVDNVMEGIKAKYNFQITDECMRRDHDTHKHQLPLMIQTLLAKSSWSTSELVQVLMYCQENCRSVQQAQIFSFAESEGLLYRTRTVSLKYPCVLMPLSDLYNWDDRFDFPEELTNFLDTPLPKPLQWLALLRGLPVAERIKFLMPTLLHWENRYDYGDCLCTVCAFHDFGIGVCVSEDIVINPYYLNAREAISGENGATMEASIAE